MNEDLSDLQYSSFRRYNYSEMFETVRYNGKELSDEQRKEVVSKMNETIATYAEGLPMLQKSLKENEFKQNEYSTVYRTVISVMQFVLITMIDSMVASKYFIMADGDYDRRFMRGKLMVILNEGFKRLYGFDEKTHKKSEWDRLLPLMKHFPEVINRDYQELTYRLEKHAKSSSWWREERNLETHMDAEKLYLSRQEELIESKVMMDSLKLFGTLQAVNCFLTNMHGCLYNYLLSKYRRGELKD